MQNLSNRERMTLCDIYEVCSRDGIAVYGFDLPQSRALSVMDGEGKCVIGIDNSRRYSETEEKTLLLHELGHCETGAFYNEATPFASVDKCEKKADEWVIRSFLPYKEMINAYRSGVRTRYELAEYFGITEQLVQKAIEYYLRNGEEYGAFREENWQTDNF